MPVAAVEFLHRANAPSLAYKLESGEGPLVVWLGGFKSDMAGTKAEALAVWARARGQGFLRFDYAGHGQSGGEFIDFTISQARQDVLDVLAAVAPSDGLLLVGSSMGGWMSLLSASTLGERVKAMLLIAPAPDFTAKLMEPAFDDEARRVLSETGVWMRPSLYEDAYPITRAFLDDGRRWSVLDAPVQFDGPVRILQGQQDPDVPWRHALLTAEKLTSPNVHIRLIKDGDHRLSRPQDIALLLRELDALLDEIS
jgi:pimeloyl-ACP methyl ester carboxylesterase